MHRLISRCHRQQVRIFHSSPCLENPVLQQKPKPQAPVFKYRDDTKRTSAKDGSQNSRYTKRNPLGVQLLSKSLHEQVFKNCTFPSPPKTFVNISLEHLKAHGLDPAQSSSLPPTEFTLPPLQGDDLQQHFHRIGIASSEPYLSLAKLHANSQLPPIPENWELQPGWTKYHHSTDGSDYSEHVEFPIHNGEPEQFMTFDVETMPKIHQYPIMACAATVNAWYVWISPWLLNPSTTSPAHLIPIGPPDVPRIIVGHNVSYDRARILEEYHLNGTKNRFLDTMSLHVAIKGISSHQRPAWMKYRKSKEDEIMRRDEAVEALMQLKQEVDQQVETIQSGGHQVEATQFQKLLDLQKNLETSLPALQASQVATIAPGSEDDMGPLLDDGGGLEATPRRWEDLTSANSLVDVAKLHCNIDISKDIRNDFMTATPEEILAGITDYLGYCASDVDVTHKVYQKVLPGFLSACPHPVSFAGVLTMGSGFLPVNEQWEAYLERAEAVWQGLEKKVRDGLEKLARAAMEDHPVVASDKDSIQPETWRDDVWLSQLDWTPKVAGKSRGVMPEVPTIEADTISDSTTFPAWYATLHPDPLGKQSVERILPLLLRLAVNGNHMMYTPKEKWFYTSGSPEGDVTRLSTARNNTKTSCILSRVHALRLLQNGTMSSINSDLAQKISQGEKGKDIEDAVFELARAALERPASERERDPWLSQLNWDQVEVKSDGTKQKPKKATKATKATKPPVVYWPKWFWDLTKPKKGMPPGSLDITIRNRFAPLLLKMSWHGFPLFFSREHGWTFRVPTRPTKGLDPAAIAIAQEKFQRLTPLSFYEPEDDQLAEASLRDGYVFYKLPHKDGDKANVGSPLTKGFLRFAVDGVMTSSAGDELKELVDIGVKCSYWISARDRILNQKVEWATTAKSYDWDMGFPEDTQTSPSAPGEHTTDQVNSDPNIAEPTTEKKWGIILPQVITMGTVTRRAIERTWLTASNAKKNRVGSELKAMVRAPPGYAIVGADVDSEELWISSCMGDAQFGMHGATAIGWMTLEGTKSAGTDLHSKTASILGISRDQAKVFNYSRIYGAGMRHAVLLLLQGNSAMVPEEAQKLAENLYASTKGKNTHRTDIFERKFWFGGSESYLFNKLEEIAMSTNPQTPALGCGVTHALMKDCLPNEFGSDYLPSRINWVVQSSGVDYLHLLIVSMDYLIKKYGIEARYLISVHDELRYLVKEEDRYRAALAMQIANLWTRCMFAHKLGMDDLPQGVAFFSAVDIDHVLRKEVDMPCVTPSQPVPIPPGECLNIGQILTKTNGGSLRKDGGGMAEPNVQFVGSLEGFMDADCLQHRASNTAFLRAQATRDFNEVKHLAKTVYGKSFEGDATQERRRRGKGRGTRTKSTPIGNGDGVDWSETIDNLLKSGRQFMS